MSTRFNSLQSFTTAVCGFVLLCLLAVSCSVKEDRTPCPAYLKIYFADRESLSGKDVYVTGRTASETLFGEAVSVDDNDPYYLRAVHKDIIRVGAAFGPSGADFTGSSVTVPLGNQADSLWGFWDEVDCTGDEGVTEVELHKQFCTVHLDFNQPVSKMPELSCEVIANTCGFSFMDYSPISGQFNYVAEEFGGERVYSFRVFRQADNTMSVRLWEHDAGVSLKYNPVMRQIGTYPLGELIVKTGYSWAALELQDVYVKIDLVICQVTISVGGWDNGVTYPLIVL